METTTIEAALSNEINMKVLQETLIALKAFLNKATCKGAFDLDEASTVNKILENLVKTAEQTDRCQKIIKSLIRNADQTKKVNEIEQKKPTEQPNIKVEDISRKVEDLTIKQI